MLAASERFAGTKNRRIIQKNQRGLEAGSPNAAPGAGFGQIRLGKSALINALLPEAKAATREISDALDSGKHTTTHTRLYRLDANSALVDNPGMQEFGLSYLTRADLEHGFVEFHPYLDKCRFRACRHDREPDCAMRAQWERATGAGWPRSLPSALPSVNRRGRAHARASPQTETGRRAKRGAAFRPNGRVARACLGS
jgi:hypothetical protein